ncbi:hypothetical protein O9992_30115 [Vibrio lentus]|nr:hypothetical protein [Vibrio lentus]
MVLLIPLTRKDEAATLTLSSEQYGKIAIDSGLPLIMQGESTVASWWPNRLKTRDKANRVA